MKANVLGVAFPFVLAAAAAAQSETSPKGFLAKEGSWVAASRFGYYTPAYNMGNCYLQVDATNLGQARTLKGLSMRRDGSRATSTAYAARTVTFRVRVAHADYAKIVANVEQQLTDILLTPWTLVMNDKQVSLPDFSQKPASGTAPFSALLAFDSSFAYSGSSALAFQILGSPSPDIPKNFSEYPIDYEYNGPAQAQQAYYGTGCIPTGFSAPMSHNSTLASFGPNSVTAWDLSTNGAQAGAPVVMLLGVTNPDLAFGGCEKLFATPDVTLSGTASGSGYYGAELTFPHRAEYIGAQVYSQSVSYDSVKGALVLSGGLRITYPADPAHPQFASGARLLSWSQPSWPTSHTLIRGSALVFGLHE